MMSLLLTKKEETMDEINLKALKFDPKTVETA